MPGIAPFSHSNPASVIAIINLSIFVLIITTFPAPGSARIVLNTDPDYSQLCHPNNNNYITDKCGDWAKTNSEFASPDGNPLEICRQFPRFPKPPGKDIAYKCVKPEDFGSIFWIIVIGLPLSLCMAYCVLIYLCVEFSYYMCCCCLFNKQPPKINKPWANKAAPVAPAAPTPSQIAAAPPPPPAETPPPATDAGADAGE